MKDLIFKISTNKEIAKNTYEMVLLGDCTDIKCGQFVNIKLDGFYLRRPISVCSVEGNSLTLIYKVVGQGTEAMAKMGKDTELLVLTAKGKRLREEVITKINELARKIGMEQNNGNIRAVYARLYRQFAANNKRWYWGNAMQAKNHLEYIGEMGGISDLKILHEILISFIDEASTFYAEENIDSKGDKRYGN